MYSSGSRIVALCIPALLLFASFLSADVTDNTAIADQDEPKPITINAPNPFSKCIIPINSRNEFLIAPGLPAVNGESSLIVLNVESGAVRHIECPDSMFLCATSRQSLGWAAVSLQEWNLTKNGLWIYKSGDDKLQKLNVPQDCALMGLIWSPTGKLIAGWKYDAKDQKEYLSYMAELATDQKNATKPNIRAIPCVIDMIFGKVTELASKGLPLCWDPTGSFLYINTGEIKKYRAGGGRLVTVNSRSDVLYAYYSQAYKSYAAIVSDGDEYEVCLVSDQFRTKKRICKIERTSIKPVLSPNGKYLAYRRGNAAYVLSLEDGIEQQPEGLGGDIGPAWIDDDAIIAGESQGELRIVSMKGNAKRAFSMAELLKPSTDGKAQAANN